jgi:hypothetical protein
MESGSSTWLSSLAVVLASAVASKHFARKNTSAPSYLFSALCRAATGASVVLTSSWDIDRAATGASVVLTSIDLCIHCGKHRT